MTSVRQNIILFEDGDELLDRVARYLASIGSSRAQILAQGEASAVELEGDGTTSETLDGPLNLLCASGHTDRTSSTIVALIASPTIAPRSGRLRCAFMRTGSAVVFAELASDAATDARASASPRWVPAPSPLPPVATETARASDPGLGHAGVVGASAVSSFAEPRIGEPRPAEPPRVVDTMVRALPPKPVKRDVEEIVYPEEGDMVTHFVFGRCVVVFSDGERLKFQQERDGRVREVALSALRVVSREPLEDGKRHFELQRRS